MSTLLVHDDRVPEGARKALRAAHSPDTHPDDKTALLESAAHILYDDTEIDCEDALELVGLPNDCGCEP